LTNCISDFQQQKEALSNTSETILEKLKIIDREILEVTKQLARLEAFQEVIVMLS